MAISAADKNALYGLTALTNGAVLGTNLLAAGEAALEGGASLEDIATALLSFNTSYTASMTNAEFVDAFLNNIAGDDLTAAQKTELGTAGAALLDGGASRGQLVVIVYNALEAQGEDSAVAAMATRLDNQIAYSTYYTEVLAATDPVIGRVSAVTSTTPVATENLEAALTPASNDSLDVGTDSIVGGKGGDTFTGVLSALVKSNTLDTTDVISDPSNLDSDTLSLVVSKDWTGFATGAGVTNVETIALSAGTATARTFDFDGITGATNVSVDLTKASMTVTGLAAGVEAGVTSMGGKSASFALETASGTADALSVSISGATSDSTLTAAGFEELTITSAGSAANVLGTLTAASATTLNLAGSAALTVTAPASVTTLASTATGATTITTGTGLTSYDGSASTGGATLTLGASTALKSVALGSGTNTISVDQDGPAANATITGGSGADTLSVTPSTGGLASAYTMSGVETVRINGSSNYNFSATDVEGVSTFDLRQTGTATLSIAGIDDAAISAPTLKLGSTGTGLVTVDAPSALTITADTTSTSATATAKATVSLPVTASAATAVTLNVESDTSYTGSVTLSKATSLTSTISGEYKTGTITAPVLTSVELATSGTSSVFAGTLSLAKAESIVMSFAGTADDSANVTVTATQAAVVVVDSIASSSDLTLTTAKATELQINAIAAGKTINLATATDLSALQELTINTSATGRFIAGTSSADTHTTESFGALANATLKGTGSVVLGNVGGTAGESLTVTVEGGLTAYSSSTVAALSAGGKNALEIGTVTTSAADIVLDVAAAKGAVLVGAITTGGSTGNVKIDADGLTGAATFSTVTANTVEVYATEATGAVTVGTITAKGSVTYNGTNLTANTVTINAASGSTTATYSIVGGILDDTFTIDGTDGTDTLTVVGNLGLGTNTITVTGGSGNDNINLSGLTVNSGDATKGVTVDVEDGTVNTVVGSAGADTITAGTGSDSLTGGGGNDIFNYQTATDAQGTMTASDNLKFSTSSATYKVTFASDPDVITDFASGDTIGFPTAPTSGAPSVATTSGVALSSLSDGDLYMIRGTYSATSSVSGATAEFSIGTSATNGSDTLVIYHSGGTEMAIVLVGYTTAAAAANNSATTGVDTVSYSGVIGS